VDDLWARDTLPTFLVPAASAPAGTPALAAAHFMFNGWGNKQVHAKDALLAKEVAALTGARLVPSGLVGEGGGIETYVISVADHSMLPPPPCTRVDEDTFPRERCCCCCSHCIVPHML
jgi:hypothetical protein